METFEHPLNTEINNLSTGIASFIGKKGIFQYIVDNIMLSSYHTFRHIASTLDSILRGFTLSQAYSQERDELVLSFNNGAQNLVVSCVPDVNTCYLNPAVARAKRNSADIFPRCWGATVRSVRIHPSDRVIIIELMLTSDARCSLVAQFFGPKSNVLLVDETRMILDAFKHAGDLVGTSYTDAHAEAIPDLSLLRPTLDERRSSSVVAVLRDLFPNLGGTLTREALLRAEISPQSRASDIDAPGYTRLLQALSCLFRELEEPEPRVYISARGVPALLSLVRLRQADHLVEQKFSDIHEAIRFFLFRRHSGSILDEKKRSLLSALRREADKSRRTLDAIRKDVRDNSRADEYRLFGSLLMTNMATAPKGARSVELSDGSGTVSIPLDPRLTAAQNARRYFEKAKSARSGHQQSLMRLENTRERLEIAELLVSELESADTKEALEVFLARRSNELAAFSIERKSGKQEQFPFRRFVVDGGFEVWAGKNSANNDLLTLKHSKPNDLWFHARGAGGSHVVLKVGSGKGEPGTKAKQQAAAIAAYYSGMKNAKVVPVAMTLKKYVRKPKGAPAGTVSLDREDVIFVEPGLPERGVRSDEV